MLAEDDDEAVVFTVASVNILQFRLTINTINNMRVVITRIKLVASLLPLKLKSALVVMVSRLRGNDDGKGSQLYLAV